MDLRQNFKQQYHLKFVAIPYTQYAIRHTRICYYIPIMSKKNSPEPDKESKRSSDKKLFSSLKEETRHSVLGIIFFVLGVFFVLSASGKSGVAGNFLFGTLQSLFGVGYFLIPILMFMLSFSFMRSVKPVLLLNSILGSILFFLSSLGLFEILFGEKTGGIVGYFISLPFIKLFDVYTSAIFLSAILVISILLIFDTKLHLGLFDKILAWREKRKEKNNLKNEIMIAKENLAIEKTIPSMTEGPEEKEKSKKKSVKKDEVEEVINLNHVTSIGGTQYSPPPVSLLLGDSGKPDVGDVKGNANIIKRTLANFGINVEMDEISIGPSVTRYALKPAEGVKLSRIVGLQNDLGLALAAHPIRIEAPIPGKSLVGIEVPNKAKTTVGLGSLISSEEFSSSGKPLLLALGKGVSGKSSFADLAKMPHLLIAGATGSGKSVAIHAVVASLLYRNSPENLRFIMVDPKRVELTLYNKIPHLLTPVITDTKKAILALKWAAKEMDRRYDILETEGARDISSYHKNVVSPAYAKAAKAKNIDEEKINLPEPMPYIVIIIDELADMMSSYPRELESAIVRLAQMSRAVGIHLILSTQRPSVNVITGLIKANIPARIALQVASQIDSRTILDASGAEKLLGQGDMLYISGEMSKPQRIQSAFVSETEVKKVVKFLSSNYDGAPSEEINLTGPNGTGEKNSLFDAVMNDETSGDDDELYEEAREIVIHAGKASSSYLQRKLKIGYARAARLIDMLEEKGVVSSGEGSKPREVIGGKAEGYGETEDER